MSVRFDREIFFDNVRNKLFDGALDQQQVDGCGVILGLWEGQYTGTPMSDIRWLAYILATVYHECATTMWPITEYGSQSYLQGKDYYPYIGRGFVMITWEENYRNASQQLSLTGTRDLVEHPELALDSLIAARILFRGMSEGWFTGRKLGQYFSATEDNPIDAREIVNGHDDDELIAGYHKKFLVALQASDVGGDSLPRAVSVLIEAPRGVRVDVTVIEEKVDA